MSRQKHSIRRFLTRWIFAGIQGIPFLFPLPTFGQATPTRYDVEAAYLFRFSKFLRLPPKAEPALPFDICTLGDDPFGRTLQQITANEEVDNRPVRIVHLGKPSDARACSILFLSASEASRVEQDLLAVRGSDVLTVGDIPGFLTRGGMIQFQLERDRVRFSISLDAVAQTRLGLGSELLRVASSVVGKARAEGTP